MSIALGFGSTEKKYESDLEDKIKAYIDEWYYEETDNYFTESFVKKVREWVDGLAKESRDIGDKYKKAETYPERYSYFWATTIADASHIVFILKLHHINRRHALSPDGWGCMTSEMLFYVDEWEAGRQKEIEMRHNKYLLI